MSPNSLSKNEIRNRIHKLLKFNTSIENLKSDIRKANNKLEKATNKSSNTYSVDICESDKVFTGYFKAENFKMITDDYDVAISSQKISHFVNRTRPVKYWIALEPDSTF